MTITAIIDRLEADIADHKRRQTQPRRKGLRFQKWWMTELHQTFLCLNELASVSEWSRADLIRLVDYAIAVADAERADEDAAAQGCTKRVLPVLD